MSNKQKAIKQDIEFNINEYCTVVLSKVGADILNEYNARSNAQFKLAGISVSTKIDYKEGDTFKNQFWYMMALFGDSLVLGIEAPFKDCNITLHKTF